MPKVNAKGLPRARAEGSCGAESKHVEQEVWLCVGSLHLHFPAFTVLCAACHLCARMVLGQPSSPARGK